MKFSAPDFELKKLVSVTFQLSAPDFGLGLTLWCRLGGGGVARWLMSKFLKLLATNIKRMVIFITFTILKNNIYNGMALLEKYMKID